MTYKEKFEQEHPNVNFNPYHGCPEDHSDDEYRLYCHVYDCADCWSREIPEDDIPKMEDASKIKDSGNRRQFESGAFRDMPEGKGRCDLMPLEVVRNYLNDEIVGYIANFMFGHDTSELYNCLDAFSQVFGGKYGACLEVSKHFEDGAKKYGENNWQKGIPVNCYIDSAIRHYLKWLRGDTDEPHGRAFVWNIMCCIWEVDYHLNEKQK